MQEHGGAYLGARIGGYQGYHKVVHNKRVSGLGWALGQAHALAWAHALAHAQEPHRQMDSKRLCFPLGREMGSPHLRKQAHALLKGTFTPTGGRLL